MKLIKNAIVYRASLPDAASLEQHLQEKAFVPVLETHISSSGFIEHPITKRLVTTFPGGFAFRLRRDEKPISMRAIRLELERRAVKLGRDLDKAERDAMFEEILSNMVKAALPERAEMDAFYHIESRTLLLPTTNRKMASVLVSQLVEACGAVETSTIHVSNIKGGLTTRLQNYFTDTENKAFEGFKIGDSVVMRGKEGKASFDLESLDNAKAGIVEAIASGMEVERLELCHADSVNFKLTHDFTLRAISFFIADEEQDFDTTEELWIHTAGVQTLLMTALVQALCDLFGYQAEGDAKSEEAAK